MRRPRQQRTRGNRDSAPQGSSSSSNQSQPRQLSQTLDINTNLGEGYGPYKMENESDVLPFVTSANIACGAHAGDPLVMEAALEEVRYYGLSLGAHIGYPDIQGFGRREIHLSTAELRASILFQLGALSGLARTLGFEITQVRPHGFLYRQIASDPRTAAVVAKAVSEYDRWLVLIGPAGSSLQAAGERAGIRVAGEAWIDRAYDANGHLLPHSHSRAIIKNPNDILNQAASLIRYGTVTAIDGTKVALDFETLHLHGGMAQARQVAEQVRNMIPHAAALTAEPFTLDGNESNELAFGVY
ncbi:MAG: 5-oxoprolinase subunit PxpA [Candidatus Obscuribacterales bacterium]